MRLSGAIAKVGRSPAKRTKLISLETPSLPPKRTKIRTSGFNSQTNVYMKHHLKPQMRFFSKNPTLVNEFCSFHWASANFCDGPSSHTSMPTFESHRACFDAVHKYKYYLLRYAHMHRKEAPLASVQPSRSAHHEGWGDRAQSVCMQVLLHCGLLHARMSIMFLLCKQIDKIILKKKNMPCRFLVREVMYQDLIGHTTLARQLEFVPQSDCCERLSLVPAKTFFCALLTASEIRMPLAWRENEFGDHVVG